MPQVQLPPPKKSRIDIHTAVSCSVDHRGSLDLVLLWHWCRPAAAAPIRRLDPLAWELSYALSAALKRQKDKKKEKKKKKRTEINETENRKKKNQ